jgi:cytosine/adenosine deaminase-related metal-dependent hydrolase
MRSFIVAASFFAVALVFASLLACDDGVGSGRGGSPAARDAGTPIPVPERPPAASHLSINPQPRVTECRTVVAPVAGEVCQIARVAQAGGRGLVLRGTILAPNETFHGGEVVVGDDGLIACVGCDCSAQAKDVSVIECGSAVISPGLINPHDHLTYVNNPPLTHGTKKFAQRSEWQGGPDRIAYKSSANATTRAFGELRYVMSGTTMMAGGGSSRGLARNVDDDVDTLEGLPVQVANSDVFPLGTLPVSDGCEYGSGRTTAGEVSQLQSYLPHIAEGISAISRNEFVCAKSAGKYDLLARVTGVIHGIPLTPSDGSALRDAKARLVWSPRSNIDLYGHTAPVTMLDLQGVQIALGTDWVVSGSMNMLRELKCADSLNRNFYGKHFTDADLWRMATENAAFAVGAQTVAGALKRGYVADLAIYAAKPGVDHRAVLDAGVEDIALVLRGGRAMYGDGALLNVALWGVTCDVFEGGVCGKEKRVCLDVPGALTLAQIRAQGEVADTGPKYPLYFCKAEQPRDEPSCEPSRMPQFDGVPKPTDSDGDGVENARDNCPDVANPFRPIDGAEQADADKDGIGDACDVCPNDPAQACSRPLAGDLDGDGFANGLDNCPEVENPDQSDTDSDARGDACDTCIVSNPGATPCPLEIGALRNPNDPRHPKPGTIVVLQQAWVSTFVPSTGNKSGVYVQGNPVAEPFQGLYVHLSGKLPALAAAVGSKLHVVGVYHERFGESWVTGAQSTFDSTELQLPVALAVVPADISNAATGEALEGLLVSIADATILDINPDPPAFKTFEFLVTGNLRVDDYIYPRYGTCLTLAGTPCPYPPVAFAAPHTGASYAVATPLARITGVVGYSFGKHKIYPRGSADLQFP